jgi:hypothetical protein
MRKTASWAAALTVAAALIISGGSNASAAAAGPAACTSTIRITSLRFNPLAVSPGQSSTATLHARNCTSQTQQTTTIWFGQFIGSGVGIPAGCAAIDPLPGPTTFTPHGTITLSSTYLVFASCTSTSLQITVQINGSGWHPARHRQHIARHPHLSEVTMRASMAHETVTTCRPTSWGVSMMMSPRSRDPVRHQQRQPRAGLHRPTSRSSVSSCC